MLFSSMTFLWIFLPMVIFGTVLLHKNEYRNLFLLAASLFFYAWGEPVYILLMLFSILMNWLSGLLIVRFTRARRFLLFLCVALNLSLLAYYKYHNFIAEGLNRLFSSAIIESKEISLPIGISFFTFQAISYIVDVYRGNCKVQKNLLHIALYISFFPQLIAGPIVRYHDIQAQIRERSMSVTKFAQGLRRFTYGLGKKVILSNCFAEVVDRVYGGDLTAISSVTIWIIAILYCLQIYYDFSGYSDMAIGLGKIFGFDIPENFNYPYLSTSIREFWQRWHISLGSWFREYVYIPLGGNRKGSLRTYCNLVIVFFLTGLWHGASLNFVFWGLYNGFFQILERLRLHRFLDKHKWFAHIYCLVIVVMGMVFFRIESLKDGFYLISKMILPWNHDIFDSAELADFITPQVALLTLIGILGMGTLQRITEKHSALCSKWKHSTLETLFCACILLYCFMHLASGTYNPFIYFRF